MDNSAPTVVSIVRQTPSESPTNFDTLTWRVTFSEAVRNVDGADFGVAGTTAAPSAAANGSSTTEYDVTASGGDLAGLNATVTLSFAGHDIENLAGIALANTTPTGANEDAYVVDNTAPRVASIVRQTPSSSPTAADEVTWRVTFSEDVTGVEDGDFAIGGTTATLSATAVAGSASAYDVKASGGDLAGMNGTVTLSFAASPTVSDRAGNALANTTPTGANDNTYVIDNAPTLVSIVRHSPTDLRTNANALTWRVTFSEGVVNVDATAFGVAGTSATLTVTANGSSTSEWDVEASGGDLAGLDGTVTLTVASGHNIDDTSGNDLANTTPTGANDNTYEVDNTAPTVVSIVRHSPTDLRTDADTLTWRVTFSEDLGAIASTDFVAGGTTATVTVAANGSSIREYDVTASGGDLAGLDGTVTLSFANGHAVADVAGNALTATTPTGANEDAYEVDNSAPTVVSIEREAPSDSPTNADSLTWRVTFSEAVSGVDASDFGVAGTTATPTVAPIGSSERSYDVTASGGDLAGLNATVTLSFSAGQDIENLAGIALANTTPTGANEDAYVVDNTAPRVASIVRQTPSSSPTAADEVTWRVTFSEDVTGVGDADFAIGGTTATLSATAVAGSASAYDVKASGGDLAGMNGTVTLSFAASPTVSDRAGNALANTTPTGANDNTYVIDNAPTLVSIVRHSPTDLRTNANALTWRVTFSEGVVNVDATAFGVAGTSATLTVTANGSSTSEWDVEASGGDLAGLDGTVTLTVASGHNIDDTSGNDLANTTPTGANDNTYEVDNTAPTVVSIVRHSPTDLRTDADTLTWRVTFSEDLGAIASTDFVAGGTTATVTVAANGSSIREYDVTASGGDLAGLDGTVTLSFANGHAVADVAGNALTATTPTGANEDAYEVDNSAPTVVSIEREAPSDSPTNFGQR